MQGLLGVFGDFLRAAFEQLGQMLAGFFASAPGFQTAQQSSGYAGAGAGSVADAAPSGALDAGQPDSPLNGGGDGGPAGTPGDGAGAAGAAGPGRKHGGARAHGGTHAHLHRPGHIGRGGRGHAPLQGGPLLPGQRLDLGQGESVIRNADGSLELTVGGAPTPSFDPPALPDAESSPMPGGLL
jgi:hypothetical protein